MISKVIIILLIAAVAVISIYFFASPSVSKGIKEDGKKEATTKGSLVDPGDIVLGSLYDITGAKDYVLMWNGTLSSYDYEILPTGDKSEQAIDVYHVKGTASSTTSLFKIKGIKLIEGETYDVKIGSTDDQKEYVTPLIIKFEPPKFYLSTLIRSSNLIECDTDRVPTDVEVIINNIKLPLMYCSIKIEPPGIICNVPVDSVWLPNTKENILEDDKIGESEHLPSAVIMVYNGYNNVSILTLD